MTPLAKKVFELFGKPELATEEERKQTEERPSTSLPCPHCGKPAEIEAVCPSLDGTRMLTLWHCQPCQTWGATPDSIRQPPTWVRKTVQ
jgi:hypothetical protein